jgi:hypothetical protein
VASLLSFAVVLLFLLFPGKKYGMDSANETAETLHSD